MRHVINHASTCLMSRGLRCLHDCILANRIDLGSALARKVSIPRVIAIECPAHAGRHICNSRKMEWEGMDLFHQELMLCNPMSKIRELNQEEESRLLNRANEGRIEHERIRLNSLFV